MNRGAPPLPFESSSAEATAELAIRRNMIGYARAADRGRAHDLAARFHDHGVLHIVGNTFDAGEYAGRHAIVERIERTVAMMSTRSNVPRLRHHISSILIEFMDEVTAVASSYFLAVTNEGPDHWGRYSDQVLLVNGVWRFARRTVIHEGFRPGAWIEQELALLAEGPA